MIIKIIKNLAIGIALIASLSKVYAIEVLPEVKVAYYAPTDSRFRDIYSGGGLYSIETSVQAWEGLYPWASVGIFYASGSSIGEGNHTHIIMVPINIGLKYFLSFDRLHPYLGLGMITAYAHIHNDSPFVVRRQSCWGVGGIVKAGFLADVSKSVFFDFFCDYSYLKINFHHHRRNNTHHRADLSGVSIGAGIGYRF